MIITANEFYVCPLTETSSTPTYGTVKKLCGVAQVDVAYNKSTNKIYENGKAIYNKTHVADAKVTLQSHTIALEDKKDLFFGVEADDDGNYIETDGAKPKKVACGFYAKMDDGQYLCTWFYSATAEPADESYKTSNESGPQIDPDSIVFNAVKRSGDRKLRKTQICANMTAVATFFATVS